MKFSKINYAMLAMLVKSAEGKQEAHCSSDDMVVFGDSLSDTGNLFAITGGALPPGPPYTAGRFTNGNVWVEYLADLMKLNPPAPAYDSANPGGTNYAIAGAASGSGETITWIPALTGALTTLPAKGFRLQISDFLDNCDVVSCCSSGMLFVIFVGANDFGLLGEGPNYENIIQNIKDGIEDLISEAGATKILVLNLPQIAGSPATVGTYTSLFINQTLPDDFMESVEMYNESLEDALKSIDGDNEDVNIIHFDIAPLVNEAASNPAKFGLDDTKDTGIPTLNEAALFLQGSLEYLNAENALFFDGVHPTTTFHEVLAKEVHKVVKKSKGFKSSKSSKSSKGSKKRRH
jgi:phospholipase/lecithinase/hemolysin